MSYYFQGAKFMKKYFLTDKEKLEQILKVTGVTRSQLARQLEVTYKTLYRWLDCGVKPHLAQSRDIDQLFKEYVDLRDVVYNIKKKIANPIKILKEHRSE